MKFLLDHLEQYIPDELVEQAEQYLEQGAISPLKEVEKNLWSANVAAGADYEVEVQLRGEKVIAYSCDCEQYGPKSVCAHLTAVFLQLRPLIRQRKEQKKEQKVALNSPKRLTTNIILQQVNPEDLKEFVRSFARTNRQFALALKARFASLVSEIDREEKYDQLLATAIKSVKRQGRGINQQGLKQLGKVVAGITGTELGSHRTPGFPGGFCHFTSHF